MVCQCQRWDSYGIPCSHMFCVMKREQIKELPETLILKRWTKNVKKIDDDQGNINGKEDEERSILMRIGALSVGSSRMIYLGGRKLSHFRYTMNEICRVTKDLEAKLEQTISPEKGKKVGDPSVAKSKGAPKVRKDENKRRQCSNCNQTGHTKRKYIETTAEKDVQHNDRMFNEDEFEDGVESVSILNDQTPIASSVEVNVKNIHFWSQKKNPQLSQEDISKVYNSGMHIFQFSIFPIQSF
ncbi:protein FAR1-RELATED SEQUENCE 9-like [Arachis ipaensis]|uniref:protein FAR1-RELATED SEQUENCE 9-like n=1 Tax=Arachis ipaensis TaxID=130454 RepID=UPI000A2AFC5B|nr:protein FAR1-RELATED SEQUENCE 9-like [Arachis ipaensis]